MVIPLFYLLTSCSINKNTITLDLRNTQTYHTIKYSGNPTAKQQIFFNSSLDALAKTLNTKGASLNLYKSDKVEFFFNVDIGKTSGATTNFQGGKAPIIFFNHISTPTLGNFFHEFMHKISAFFSSAGIKNYDANTAKGLTGFLLPTKYTPDYLLKYNSVLTKDERKKLFMEIAWSSNKNIFPLKFRYATANLVANILSDEIFRADSIHYYAKSAAKGNLNYILAPEELLARAFVTFSFIKNLPESERFVDKGLMEGSIFAPLTADSWKVYFPNDHFNSFGAYTKVENFNPTIAGLPRISRETFEAFEDWIKVLPL
jgi:hypothetical protein